MTITSALLVNGGSIKLEATRCPYGPSRGTLARRRLLRGYPPGTKTEGYVGVSRLTGA